MIELATKQQDYTPLDHATAAVVRHADLVLERSEELLAKAEALTKCIRELKTKQRELIDLVDPQGVPGGQ